MAEKLIAAAKPDAQASPSAQEPATQEPTREMSALLALKRAAELLDCTNFLGRGLIECTPAQPCPPCLVHADIKAEIRKLEAQSTEPPQEKP